MILGFNTWLIPYLVNRSSILTSRSYYNTLILYRFVMVRMIIDTMIWSNTKLHHVYWPRHTCYRTPLAITVWIGSNCRIWLLYCKESTSDQSRKQGNKYMGNDYIYLNPLGVFLKQVSFSILLFGHPETSCDEDTLPCFIIWSLLSSSYLGQQAAQHEISICVCISQWQNRLS